MIKMIKLMKFQTTNHIDFFRRHAKLRHFHQITQKNSMKLFTENWLASLPHRKGLHPLKR